ncbi:MAG TPA: hypothetical protein VF528_10665 [Pyrinomonadaceae bacterium]|jgi:hypothetical protein
MTTLWSPLETNTHQDHVIAHVLGTTVLGYFIMDEAAHLLLDIGFIWTIYVDTEMALLPQSVAVNELALEAATRAALLEEITLLHDGREQPNLRQLTPAPVECLITEIACYSQGEQRRVVLRGEDASLAIETSLEDDDALRVTTIVICEGDAV